jgi:hypothetical protein
MLFKAVADVDYARATVHSPVFAAAAAGHGAVGTAAQWRSRTLPVQGLHLRAYVEKGEEPVIESGDSRPVVRAGWVQAETHLIL